MADNSKQWEVTSRKYRTYIKVELRLANNTVESYMRDVANFAHYILHTRDLPPKQIEECMIENYMAWLFDRGHKKSSQARILSSLKSFFNYLQLCDQIEASPVEFVESPRLTRPLPDVLSVEDIDRMIGVIDPATDKGIRDRAIIELIYSCGLRVSEAISLRLCDLFFGEGYIRVIGKGDKQRLIPISSLARERVQLYLDVRDTKGRNVETLFLNNRAKPISRIMVFNIIKESSQVAGIQKSVSPHTLRHSFATHLIEGGASIRQVQEMLGHENISTTEIYTHLNAERLRETVEKYLPL